MAKKIERQYSAEFIAYEVDPLLSRQAGTIVGGDYAAGTVMGKITSTAEFTQLAPAASDGSEVADAVLLNEVDASGADQLDAVVERLAVLNDAELVWPSGITGPQKTTALAQLLAKNIRVK